MTNKAFMIYLPYSLMIEASEEPDYFSFFSPELEGFTGSGSSIEDWLHQAKLGMKEHVELLIEHGMPVPPPSTSRGKYPQRTQRYSGMTANDQRDANGFV